MLRSSSILLLLAVNVVVFAAFGFADQGSGLTTDIFTLGVPVNTWMIFATASLLGAFGGTTLVRFNYVSVMFLMLALAAASAFTIGFSEVEPWPLLMAIGVVHFVGCIAAYTLWAVIGIREQKQSEKDTESKVQALRSAA